MWQGGHRSLQRPGVGEVEQSSFNEILGEHNPELLAQRRLTEESVYLAPKSIRVRMRWGESTVLMHTKKARVDRRPLLSPRIGV
jgi:hypothetical protein